MGVVYSIVPSSGYLSHDLWVWPMGSCDLISHTHRSHGTPPQHPLAATAVLLSPKSHIHSLSRLPNVTVRLVYTTVQPTDHQNHSTVTINSPSLSQKVCKIPLYCIKNGPGFSKFNIIFNAEYCAPDSNVTLHHKLIVYLLYQNLKDFYRHYQKKSHCFQWEF